MQGKREQDAFGGGQAILEEAGRAAGPGEQAELAGQPGGSSVIERLREAEHNAELLRRLQHVTVALNKAHEPDDVARVVIEDVIPALGASGGLIAQLSADGQRFAMLLTSGYPQSEELTRWQEFPASLGTPIAHAVRSAAPVFIESVEALRASGMWLPTQSVFGNRAWAVLPLTIDGTTIGALGLSFSHEQTFPAADRDFMATVAQQCAQGLQRSQLLEEERRARRELEAEHRRLQQVIDAMPFGVVVVRDGRYELQNAAATRLFGLEMTGMLLPISEQLPFSLLHLDGRPYPRGELPLQRTLRTGEVVTGEQLLVQGPAAAEPVPLLVSCSPLTNGHGAINGVVSTFEDISELKRAENRRTALLTRMSHDVKNPLASIKLLSQLAERRAVQGSLSVDQAVQRFREVELMASRAVTILNNVMQMARHEMGLPLQLRMAGCDLMRVVRRLVAEHQSTTDRHHILVSGPSEPVLGLWDETALDSVVDNLLSNAIKYSPDGGPILVNVNLEGESNGRRAVLSVRDSGRGILPADVPHVFDQFFRSGDAGFAAGTGVGLSTVKEIVQAHGGTIQVASTPGRGSTFTVRLPLPEP